AEGYQPKLVSKADPMGRPFESKLAPNPGAADQRQTVSGRVVDPRGNPVETALIEPYGLQQGDRGRWGALDGMVSLAVTNHRGECSVSGVPSDGTLTVKVAARQFAPQTWSGLAPGKSQEIVMKSGATIRGRVMSHGEPVSNLGLGMAHTDRSAGSFKGHFEI